MEYLEHKIYACINRLPLLKELISEKDEYLLSKVTLQIRPTKAGPTIN